LNKTNTAILIFIIYATFVIVPHFNKSVYTNDIKPTTTLPTTTLPTAVITEDDLPPEQQPTPWESVDVILDILKQKLDKESINFADQVLIDFGAGYDARILIRACQKYGTKKAIGIEIDPIIAESARQYVRTAGLKDRITIITGDSREVDVEADVGVAYLFEDVLEDLVPKFKKLKRVVSFSHDIPNLNTERISNSHGEFYLYPTKNPTAKPARPQQRPVAIYGGQIYYYPLCNSRTCRMCQKIREQLAAQQRLQ